MSLTDLLSDSTVNETDKSKKKQLVKAECNTIECFFAFIEEAGLGVQLTLEDNPGFLAISILEKRRRNQPNDPGHGGRG